VKPSRKHLHHHLDRVDPVAFDYRALLASRPLARRVVVGLEWLHLPALELLLRAVSVARPFRQRAFAGERARVAGVVASRLLFAAALLALGPSTLALYAVAGLLFVVVARFGDAFHHTFELVVVPDYGLDFGPPPGKDRAYEQAHTFTNPVSVRWPALNLLLLNFVFHNAHHHKPGVPWHRLPDLDRRLYGDDRRRVAPLRRLLADFHRHRLARLGGAGPGAVGVSLLTL
jgi:fatty acid desaturase